LTPVLDAAVTVSEAFPLTLFCVAVTVVDPVPVAVASPEELIVAIAELALAQVDVVVTFPVDPSL
jgi:hypothetical protein